jgi:hypothetical protein
MLRVIVILVYWPLLDGAYQVDSNHPWFGGEKGPSAEAGPFQCAIIEAKARQKLYSKRHLLG